MIGTAPRHPLDPEERSSSKAGAVLVLGISAMVLMLCGGGLVPAALGLVLAADAREELRASAGFLTGGRMLRVGTALSWVALVGSALVLVLVVVGALVATGQEVTPEYGENVD